MVVLHQGVLSHFDCNQRMGVVFLGALIVQAAVISVSIWRGSHTSDGYVIETLNDEPLFTRRHMITFGIATIIVLTISAIVMCSRTETLLSMDGAFITETSCIGPFTDEYQLNRSQVVVEHRVENDETIPSNQRRRFLRFLRGGSDRSAEDNYLAISEPGKSRTLFVELYEGGDVSALAALAPQAMQHYADHLRAVREGQHRLLKTTEQLLGQSLE